MNYPEEPTSPAVSPGTGGDRLCDYLRKVRESKRITLDKMARDTKLNLDYLYALEQGDFQAIPAETYIRIYLRSVAKYLQLDPNEIIARYQKEIAKPEETSLEEKKTTRGLAAIARQPKIKPIGIGVFVFALIIIFSFLRTSKQPEAPAPAPPLADTVATDTAAIPKNQEFAEKKTRQAPADSLTKPGPADTIGGTAATPDTLPRSDSMVLVITCVKESCWVLVLRDYKNPTRFFMRRNETASFKSDSVFHVSLGQAGSVSVSLSGRNIYLPARNQLRFSLTRQRFRKLSYPEWVKRFPVLRDTVRNAPADSL